MSERACSYCMSVCNSPIAAVMPGATGTMISFAAIASASATPCSGPAPPKGTSANSRGSMPRADRVRAYGQRHVRVDDLDDAERGVLDRQAERLRHLGFDGLVREVGIERQVAAEHLVGVEAAENDLRVGDGRLLAALAVAGGARFGAGRARPDVKAARGIDIGDRAAAGADRDEIDHRHQNGMAVHVRVRAHS